jgi:glutathionyl-hydroquinone reductase
MGELIDGQWVKTGIESVIVNGTLKRPSTIFRDWIMAEDSPNPRNRESPADPCRTIRNGWR